ncbi:MAG: type II toxin-antitoxin system PemK/MazF family toxin [Actinobacteria bacterium]|nr:type II toxin-antitoxin system PemK/MazF family toxin [Actinomycetota bacterium]
MRRGDLVTVAGGGYASKPRPALIIQDDRFAGTDSLTICPLTTTEVEAPLLRVLVRADEANGLVRDSAVMIDKVTTVRRGNAQAVVGHLDAATLIEVERRILVFLGFGA